MDLSKISYASFILDLTNQVLRQTEDEKIFPLLKESLIKIGGKRQVPFLIDSERNIQM